MKLTELDPHWVERDGARVGFTLLCPHCQTTRLFIALDPLRMRDQCALLARDYPDSGGDIVPAKQNFAWKLEAGTTFDDMTISPSVDASASGHWHGWIKAGAID